MARVGDRLLRSIQTKQEEAADIDAQLSRMEDEIRKLKIDFDIFFNGASKRPPLEARASTVRLNWLEIQPIGVATR